MRAIAHPHAGAARVQGHLQVVRGVTDHQGALGPGAKLAHQFVEHQGAGLARRLIGRA